MKTKLTGIIASAVLLLTTPNTQFAQTLEIELSKGLTGQYSESVFRWKDTAGSLIHLESEGNERFQTGFQKKSDQHSVRLYTLVDEAATGLGVEHGFTGKDRSVRLTYETLFADGQEHSLYHARVTERINNTFAALGVGFRAGEHDKGMVELHTHIDTHTDRSRLIAGMVYAEHVGAFFAHGMAHEKTAYLAAAHVSENASGFAFLVSDGDALSAERHLQRVLTRRDERTHDRGLFKNVLGGEGTSYLSFFTHRTGLQLMYQERDELHEAELQFAKHFDVRGNMVGFTIGSYYDGDGLSQHIAVYTAPNKGFFVISSSLESKPEIYVGLQYALGK